MEPYLNIQDEKGIPADKTTSVAIPILNERDISWTVVCTEV